MTENSQKIQKAIAFATEKHKDMVRKGTGIPGIPAVPYILHPLEAMEIVASITNDEDAICAAVLHDTVEDAHVTLEELKKLFGTSVASLVADESENKREGIPPEDTWKIRKQEALEHLEKASREAKIIALGDKLSNIRSIQRDYADIGEDIWQRFNCKIKSEHGWYYKSIAKILENELSHTDAWQEYNLRINAVFG